MTGTVELDPDRIHLQIRFPYREDLVAEVKALPQRRWDPSGKLWRVPVTHAEAVYKLLARHRFEFSSDVMSVLAGTLGAGALPTTDDARPVRSRAGRWTEAPSRPAAEPAQAPADAQDAAEAWSISELNARVQKALRGAFPAPLWVVGEILDFDKSEGRRARFFKLVEKREGEPRPRAAVEVALFENTMRRLLPALAAAAEPLTLRDGIEVRALVRVDLYPETGQYRVVIEDIDPSFTLGKLALERERILRELRAKGLDRLNLQKPVPVPPLRLGVLASPDSDGWNDLLRQLEESRFGFQITLLPVRVQGPELKPTLLAGLEWFAQRQDDFDALCIVRGGGSRTDLSWFDDLQLALAVARHPLKILLGIGHERDRSVLDEIAHSEKTPTAVAAFLVACVRDAGDRLAGLIDRLAAASAEALASGRDLLREGAGRMRSATSGLLAAMRERLGHAAARLLRESRRALRESTHALALARADLVRCATAQLRRESESLERCAERLRLLDPKAVLQRGYALLRDGKGTVITDAARLRKGDAFTARLRDGVVRARTEAIDIEPTS